MPLTLADVLREHWASYACAHRARLCAAHYRAVRSVLACRGPELGGKLYRCDGCRKWHFAYHSCNHRSCPQCGALDQQIWTAKQEARLLSVPYFMITFTVPQELRPLCAAHPKELYNLIMKESAGALQDVIETKLGGTAGSTSVLHTWGRQKQHDDSNAAPRLTHRLRSAPGLSLRSSLSRGFASAARLPTTTSSSLRLLTTRKPAGSFIRQTTTFSCTTVPWRIASELV